MTTHKVGNKVKWRSQAGGSITEKTGTVVYIITKNDVPPYEVARTRFPDHQRMFDGLNIPGSGDFGYLVEVRDGKTDKAKPKLYMPYPSKLVVA